MRERYMRRVFLCTFLAAMLLVSVAPAWASIAPMPEVRIEWGLSGSWQEDYPDASGTHAFSGNWSDTEGLSSWTVTYKPDPYLVVGLSVANPTSVTMDYHITFEIPVAPSLADPTVYGGSTGGDLSTDPQGGTISTIDDTPLYQALIDDTAVLGLYPHESSWSRTSIGTTDILAVEAGNLPSGDVLDTIGIQYNFSLTPGDTAVFAGTFEVIPEPATLAILGLGGMIILGRKRR